MFKALLAMVLAPLAIQAGPRYVVVDRTPRAPRTQQTRFIVIDNTQVRPANVVGKCPGGCDVGGVCNTALCPSTQGKACPGTCLVSQAVVSQPVAVPAGSAAYFGSQPVYSQPAFSQPMFSQGVSSSCANGQCGASQQSYRPAAPRGRTGFRAFVR